MCVFGCRAPWGSEGERKFEGYDQAVGKTRARFGMYFSAWGRFEKGAPKIYVCRFWRRESFGFEEFRVLPYVVLLYGSCLLRYCETCQEVIRGLGRFTTHTTGPIGSRHVCPMHDRSRVPAAFIGRMYFPLVLSACVDLMSG